MARGFVCKTKVGNFYIVPHQGRWHAVFDDESLGSYEEPYMAADDLSGGHTFTPSSGVDTAVLGIPDDLSQWDVLD